MMDPMMDRQQYREDVVEGARGGIPRFPPVNRGPDHGRAVARRGNVANEGDAAILAELRRPAANHNERFTACLATLLNGYEDDVAMELHREILDLVRTRGPEMKRDGARHYL